jgi:uncharacterized membrane protein YsdA (DUF1294 family)
MADAHALMIADGSGLGPRGLAVLAGAAWYALSGLIALAAFAWDKRAASAGRRRLRERTLLAWTWAGGFFGAWVGVHRLRHKSRRARFRLAPYGAALLHAGLWLATVRLGWWR